MFFSLVGQGFERFYFINGHGGNLAPVKASFQEIYMQYSLKNPDSHAPRCRIRSWWEYPETNALRNSLYNEKEGMHATPSEVSIVQYTFPDNIKEKSFKASWHPVSYKYIQDHAEDDHFDASDHINRHPDGFV